MFRHRGDAGIADALVSTGDNRMRGHDLLTDYAHRAACHRKLRCCTFVLPAQSQRYLNCGGHVRLRRDLAQRTL